MEHLSFILVLAYIAGAFWQWFDTKSSLTVKVAHNDKPLTEQLALEMAYCQQRMTAPDAKLDTAEGLRIWQHYSHSLDRLVKLAETMEIPAPPGLDLNVKPLTAKQAVAPARDKKLSAQSQPKADNVIDFPSDKA